MADWSELPGDVVGLITSFLPLADTHRFSAVCQNWCSVTKQNRHPPAPEMPWLVLDDDKATGKRKFFNMSEKKHYYFDIPELRGAVIKGSSFGWLFAVGPRLDAYLLNPFSGAKFSLPPLPFPKNGGPDDLIDNLSVKRDRHGRPKRPCLETRQHYYVIKAILSADPSKCPDFVLLISLMGDLRLAFYKSGDPTWTAFGFNRSVKDIFFFNGEFYALLANIVLTIVDIGPKPKLRGRWQCIRGYDSSWSPYLVDYYGPNSNSFLLVVRWQEIDENDVSHYITEEFRVFEIDLKGFGIDLKEDDEKELEDVEGHALFLGTNCNIVARASDFSGCIPNSIYFSSDVPGNIPKRKYGYDDLGVYKLEDESITHFYPLAIYKPPQSCPIWLVPNPW